jgi:hypothetical protein
LVLPISDNQGSSWSWLLEIFSDSQHLWLSNIDAKFFYNVGNIRPSQQQHQATHIMSGTWTQGAPIMAQHGVWFDFDVATSNHIHRESGNQHI